MLRKFPIAVLVCVAIAGSSQTVAAQQQAFTANTLYVGPTIGLGGIGSASLSIGGRVEKGLGLKLGKDIPGALGVLVSLDYYSWSASGAGWEQTVRYVPIGVTANYHFPLANKKLDPFVGAGLGYYGISNSCNFPGGTYDCGGSYGSSLYFIGRAGGQYYVTSSMGVYADIGAGAALINAGLMFHATR